MVESNELTPNMEKSDIESDDFKKTQETIEELKAQIDDFKKTQASIKELKTQINTLKRTQKTQEKLLNSHYLYFNNLYLDFDLKPKGVLEKTHILSNELLDFIDNVCKKYDLKWWLDFGNLLGAVRHGDFVPWDDDIDIAMMREDSIKFLEVIDKELKLNNLDDIIKVSTRRVINNERVVAFPQIMIFHHGIYAGLDIFPKDFISSPPDDIKEIFSKEREKYHEDLFNEVPEEEALDVLYDNLQLSYEEQDFCISGIETPKFPSLFMVIETDKVFPLKEIEFRGSSYPCPNDYDLYLKKIYGEKYHSIPPKIERHERTFRLKQKKNSIENFNVFINRLKHVNNNFLY